VVNQIEIVAQIVNSHRDVLAEHGDLHAHHRVVVPSALRHFKMPFGAKHAGGHCTAKMMVHFPDAPGG